MDSHSYFRQVPFFRLLAPYVIGVCTVHFFSAYWAVIAISILTVLAGGYVRFFFMRSEQARLYKGMIIFSILFVCGSLSCMSAKKHCNLPAGQAEYFGIINNKPVDKPKTIQSECYIYRVVYNGQTIELQERVLLYLQPSPLIKHVQIGDSIAFKARLQKIKNPGNPGEFDYAGYMANQGVYCSAFIPNKNYTVGNKSSKFKLKRWACQAQQIFVKKFRDLSISGDEFAVLSALTVGDREYITDGLYSSYIASGAIHILSVSGMHVGILYLLLNLLFRKTGHQILFQAIRLLVILSAIWSFALITGMSSSVVRASVMFSLFLLGKGFYKPINSYNLLSASAFMMLIYNPLELFQVGFQLSYLAVFGILFFQPRLANLFSFKNWLINWTWQLFAVSIAAQIPIIPLILYYFHQFPVYFLLTNILVIPAVWLVMILSLLVFLALPFSSMAEFMVICLNAVLLALNWWIRFIAIMPGSTICNIRFENYHLVVYGLLIVIGLILIYKQKIMQLLKLTVICVAIILLSDIVVYNMDESKQEIVFYNAQNMDIISFIDGHRHFVLVGPGSLGTRDSFMRITKNYFVSRQIEKKFNVVILDSLMPQTQQIDGKFILANMGHEIDLHFGKCQLVIPSNTDKKNAIGPAVGSYYLLISKNTMPPDYYKFRNGYPKKIVILSSAPNKVRKQWKKYAEQAMVSCSDIKNDGADLVEL